MAGLGAAADGALTHGGVPRTSRSISSSSDSAEVASPDSSKQREAEENLAHQLQSDALEETRSENTAIDATAGVTREHEGEEEDEEEPIPTDVKVLM